MTGEKEMVQLDGLLKESIGTDLYQMVLSNPRSKEGISKRKIRPVLVKDQLLYQVSSFTGTKVYHDNLDAKALKELVLQSMQTLFRQAEITCKDYRATVLVSKKGKMTIQKKMTKHATGPAPDLAHNKIKKYILQEGRPIPFLVDLGVQTPDGKIVRAKYDKYRQINRYLEFIEDILPVLPTDRTVNIIDFGCGKSYLTFALYYYLKIIKNYDIHVIGLDLKEDVIDSCNQLREKYGYHGLSFVKGDIASFTGTNSVDMVVTLHACDTATDYALEKAVRWGARVILSVPCCQHEINRQIDNETLQPLLKYGLLKERLSALITDGIRAELLEKMGYETQLLEFIDMEHTPKNILIRAVRKSGPKTENKELDALMEMLHIQPTLAKLLNEE